MGDWNRQWKRLWRVGELLWASGPAACAGLLALTLVEGVLPSAQLWVGKLIVDAVVQAGSGGGADVPRALTLVAAELGIIALAVVVRTGRSLLQEIYGERLTFEINRRILVQADALDLTYFEDPQFYDMLQRAQREAGYRPLGLLMESLGILSSLVNALTLGAMLSRLGLFVVPVLLVAGIPSMIATVRFARSGYLLVRARTPEARQMSYIKSLLGTDQAAKEVKLYGLGPFLVETFSGLFGRVHRESIDLALRQGGARLVGSLVAAAGYAGLYGALVWQAMAGRFTVGDLTLYAGAVLQLERALEGLLNAGVQIYQKALFIDDLFAFLDLAPRAAVPAAPRPLPATLREGFRFEGVSFRYPGAERDALSGIDLVLAPGHTVALVGENGSGKTTLVKLLCGLYQPTAGRILLEGHPLSEYDPRDLRTLIGVVFQDFVRFHATARDNIGYGRIDEREDLPRIALAAERGGADALIARLADGYETMLGKWFREGQDLSGGQWQKIALARAYMRDAPVIVLDEPTSALDPRAEHEVFERFRDLRQGRIALLISHRFSTVVSADTIVVLEHGRIVEVGSHRDLVACGGRYAELFALQAEAYLPQTQNI